MRHTCPATPAPPHLTPATPPLTPSLPPPRSHHLPHVPPPPPPPPHRRRRRVRLEITQIASRLPRDCLEIPRDSPQASASRRASASTTRPSRSRTRGTPRASSSFTPPRCHSPSSALLPPRGGVTLLPVPRPRQVPLPRPCRRTRLGDGAGDGDSLLGSLRPPRERGRGRVGAAGGRNSAPLRAGILEIGNLIEEPFTAYESQRRPLLPLTEARREDAERVAEAQPRE